MIVFLNVFMFFYNSYKDLYCNIFYLFYFSFEEGEI